MMIQQKKSKFILLTISLSMFLLFVGVGVNINSYALDNKSSDEDVLTQPKESWTYTTRILRPNEEVSNNGFQSSPIFSKINDAVTYPNSGGDSSYIIGDVTTDSCEVKMSTTFQLEGQSFTSIKIYARGRKGGTPGDTTLNVRFSWRLEGGSFSTPKSVNFDEDSFHWLSTSSWDNLDLSKIELDHLQIRIRIGGIDEIDKEQHISVVYAEITVKSNENPTVNVISPNGGEIVQNTALINWSYSDPEGQTLRFELSYSVIPSGTFHTIVSGLVNVNSYEWDLSEFTERYDSVRIMVEAWDGNGGYDYDHSDDYFEIFVNHEPVVNLTSPNGGETLQGSSLITWNCSDTDGDTLTFNISYDIAGAGWTPIVSGLVDETSYEWDLSGFPQRSDQVLVKIEVDDGYEGFNEDVSDNYFEIFFNHNPTIILTSPNGGETLRGNSTIAWNCSDIDGDTLTFNISYNIAGTIWQPIVSGLVNVSSYDWDLGGFAFIYDQVRIKVQVHDDYNGYAEDVSDNPFVINAAIEELETIPSFNIFIVVASACFTGVFLGIRVIKKKRKKFTLT